MAKPIPGLDVPVINPTGQMSQSWYEFYQSLYALLNSTATTLAGIPALIAATVTSIGGAIGAITLGYGLSVSGQSLRAGLSSITSSLGADVALNNTATYFDGPTIAQGTTGTWFVSGTVTLLDTAATASIHCKLWDGTTVIASSEGLSNNTLRGVSVSLSGIITSPAANLRISCRDADATSGKILFNATGSSKDSTITAVRLA